MNVAVPLVLILLFGGAPAHAGVPDSFIDGHAKKHRFSGSIAIRRDRRIVFEKSYGQADIAFEVANSPRTTYRIASITKLFTAVLVMQLHEQGRIDLDKPIRHYLPDYAGAGADTVTIHQLLNHTSGIAGMEQVASAEDAISKGMPVYQLPHTSDQLLERHASGPLVESPGSTFAYNNADYVVLGKVIERVSGQPFDRVLGERILKPLGMTHSGMLRQGDIVKRLAATYFFRSDLGALANDLPVYAENWYAAGAMYSTLADLLAFSDALFEARLVGRESLARMFAPGLDDYGYGLWSYAMTINGKPHAVVKRPGRIMGAQSQLFHMFDPPITIVILGNTDSTDLDEFVAAIARRMVD